MNISQQQITYIISLLEYKNFGKAADACFVTQPTLSMQIKKAEDTLGYKIFDRNRNPIELTDFGEKLMPILYEMQIEYEKIYKLAKSNEGKIIDEVKIGIIPTIASYLVPKLFENKHLFSNQIKWAIVELKSEEILEQIHAKKIDLGIMAGPIDKNNYTITNLYNEEILIYNSGTKGKKLHISEIENEQPWLLNSGNCLRTQMIHFCKLSENFSSAWNYEGGNVEMLIKMVDSNGGYTLIPDFYQKLYSLDETKIKHIYAENPNQFPARNVIGISSLKNSKHEEILSILNFIKLNFANQDRKNFDILSWR
jgi:LysR family transcriptional regulator, hydrogen peroxide-inducible genes activator